MEKWKAIELDMQIYKERDGVFILSEIPDLFQVIDDCVADINMILGNRFVTFIRKKCEDLKKEIQNASKVVDAWVEMQRQWIYLENIFTSPELRKSLSRDALDFDGVNKFFTGMCAKAAKMTSISRFVKQPNVSFENIDNQNKILERVEKAL
jgi:dynein heavy chain